MCLNQASRSGSLVPRKFETGDQIMITDLVTLSPDDPLDLAANLMDWHRIRQLPVEDGSDGIVGLLSYRRLLRVMASSEIMRSFGIGSLPVVDDGLLVGLVTEHDFMNIAGVLMLQDLDARSADA